MKLKNLLSFFSLLTLLALCITACSKKETAVETYNNEAIEAIHVSADFDNIIFATSDNSELKVTLEDSEEILGSLSNGILTITGSKVKHGVNISGAKTMYIYLPKKQYEEIMVDTEVGKIEIKDINAKDISLNSEHGEITITNISGVLEATTSMGTIETSNEAGITVQKEDGNLVQQASGQLGSDTEKNIQIQTNTGKIIVN